MIALMISIDHHGDAFPHHEKLAELKLAVSPKVVSWVPVYKLNKL